MTTNLEWLYENDCETLIAMIAGECDNCKFDNDCASGDYRCDRDWLEAKHEEPDSWEKIENDVALCMVDYCETVLNEYVWDLTYEQMHNAIVKDVVNRCKKLAGVG